MEKIVINGQNFDLVSSFINDKGNNYIVLSQNKINDGSVLVLVSKIEGNNIKSIEDRLEWQSVCTELKDIINQGLGDRINVLASKINELALTPVEEKWFELLSLPIDKYDILNSNTYKKDDFFEDINNKLATSEESVLSDAISPVENIVISDSVETNENISDGVINSPISPVMDTMDNSVSNENIDNEINNDVNQIIAPTVELNEQQVMPQVEQQPPVASYFQNENLEIPVFDDANKLLKFLNDTLEQNKELINYNEKLEYKKVA